MAAGGESMNEFVDALRWLGDPAHWSGSAGVPARFVEHLWLTGASLLIVCVVAIPVGLWLGHVGRGGTLAINISNVGRAVPTFAALALLFMTPLRLSDWTVIIALVIFGLPPVLTNTYVGMREVVRDAVDAARGMGMDATQIVWKVELPLAIPLIMNGVRLAAVQIVATATVAALVAGGGLGRIITAGFGRGDRPQMIAGAILVAVMALLVEAIMEYLQRRTDPMRRIRSRPLTERSAAV
jgi:osmoprotectant transport system permease protein